MMIDTRWAGPSELADIARFFAREIALDDKYISHGEVQGGLSADGQRWVADLETRMIEDFVGHGPDHAVAVAIRDAELVGAIVVHFTRTRRIAYMTIEDLVVAPACRSDGVGAALVALAEAAGRERNMAWAFLESGLGNKGAHRFFERCGFQAMSQVFSKPL